MKPLSARIEGEQRYQRLIAGPPDTAGIKSGCVTLRPGEAVGEHVTEGKEEVIIVLKGAASVFCTGTGELCAEAGSVVYVPPQTAHDVRNTGSDLLQYIFVVAPIS